MSKGYWKKVSGGYEYYYVTKPFPYKRTFIIGGLTVLILSIFKDRYL